MSSETALSVNVDLFKTNHAYYSDSIKNNIDLMPELYHRLSIDNAIFLMEMIRMNYLLLIMIPILFREVIHDRWRASVLFHKCDNTCGEHHKTSVFRICTENYL